MAGAGYKTFTAGEVLTASDVNTYLMQQSVQNYGGTAARASAIPTPSTGMVSYIGTTGTATIPQLEVYTGTAWQAPYGMTLVGKGVFASGASLSMNNVFSSNYENYRIVLRGAGTTAAGTLTFKLRVSGADNSGNNYQIGGYDVTSLGGGATRNGNTATYWGLCPTSNDPSDSRMNVSMDIFNPFNAAYTSMNYMSSANGTYPTGTYGAGFHSIASSFDGFSFLPSSGNIAASIYVYGYRNA